MKNRTYYEYDKRKQVLIRICRDEAPLIIDKNDLRWRNLGPDDDMYARAIYLGQGCWEDLTTVTKEEGDKILREWGYSENG
jgi:hypothetical protein